jgi:MFS superfamily sulfate permease-like transporter
MTRHGEDDPPQAPPPGVRAQDGYGRGVSPFRPAARRPLLRRLVPVSKRLPGYGGGGPLVVVAAAIVVSAALDLAADGVAVVGEIPSGLPGIQLPGLGPGDALALLPAALGIFFVSYSDEILTARSFAGHRGEHVGADTELGAMGAANLAAGIGQGFPSRCSTCPRRSWGRSSWPPGSAS